jgi:hypothetical protein
MLKFTDLQSKSPLKDLRSFIKQENLDVSSQVGGRSHRTSQDVFLDIVEVMKEREQLELLRKNLFEKTENPKKQFLVYEEDVSSEEEEFLEEKVKNQEYNNKESLRMINPETKVSINEVKSVSKGPNYSPSVVINSSGELAWSKWFLIKSEKYNFLNQLPSSPSVYEVGIALRELDSDHQSKITPIRDRIRITNIKYLGSSSNLQETVKSHCTNLKDPLNKDLSQLVKEGYDAYIHLFPVTTKGAADKILNKLLFSWCYEWNSQNQERCKNSLIKGKVYFPQRVEVDLEVLEKMKNFKLDDDIS